MKVRAAIFIVIGVLCLIVGGLNVARAGSAPVGCGSDTMQPGDLCDITKDGKTTTLTYDGMRSRDNTTNWILVCVGVLGVVVGPLTLWRESRKRAAIASAPALPTA